MPTKAHGPLISDYHRALKAAKKFGAKAVRVEIGDTAIAIFLTDDYLEKMAQGHPPSPDTERGKPKLVW